MNTFSTKNTNVIWSDFNSDFEQTANKGTAIELNINAIRTSIKNILSTPRGTDLMNPYFGTDLYKFIFEQLDEINMQFLKDVVRNDINSQESRITIKSITITKESDNVLNLAIIFSLKNSDLEDAIYYTALLT
jgi:phage baseplate assembly protein W